MSWEDYSDANLCTLAKRLLDQNSVEEAVAAFRELAERGDADCQIFYASLLVWWDWMYDIQERALSNPDEALKWLEPHAQQGNLKAQYFLSLALEAKGYSGEAVEWLRKAAEKNYGPANVRLGMCYASGKYVPKDKGLAARHFQLAHQGRHVFGSRFYGESLMKDKNVSFSKRIKGFILYIYSYPKGLVFAFLDRHSEHFML